MAEYYLDEFKDFLPVEVSEILRESMYLTTEEFGAYMLLLFTHFKSQKPLPNDDIRLAMIARLPLEKWKQIKSTVMEFFYPHFSRDENGDEEEQIDHFTHYGLAGGNRWLRESIDEMPSIKINVKDKK